MKTAENATISLGKPIVAPCLIPVLHDSTPNCISDPFVVDGKVYKVTALSFGTPHAAVIVDDVDDVNVPALGAALGTHPLFPEGASVVFIQKIENDTIKVRLWQRGAGETAFTSEAACVAGTASMMLQKIMNSKATVLMGAKTVQVEWDRVGDARLTDPVDLVDA